MPKIVISDTSTLILFQKIEQFELLNKLYGEVVTTPEIAEEYGPNGLQLNQYQTENIRNFSKHKLIGAKLVQLP
ncbi:MAG: hypothetical protein PF517_05170 [Salinivirgaceae bacterium]|jgi:predicted nucleic acid-binding protein|nr:hypothetical protein [Salinivirgaceae bacterium]